MILKDCEIRVNHEQPATYDIYGFGEHGAFYRMDLIQLEMLFVALGDKISEIKGGLEQQPEGVD